MPFDLAAVDARDIPTDAVCGYGKFSREARGVRDEICPNKCYFHEFQVDGGILVHPEGKREPQKIYGKHSKPDRAYACKILIWNTSKFQVRIDHPFDVHVVLGRDQAVLIRSSGLPYAFFEVTVTMEDGTVGYRGKHLNHCDLGRNILTDAKAASMTSR